MRTPLAAVATISLFAGLASGQSAEFRIVERTGQTVIGPVDYVLDFAVQARIVGGPSNSFLGNFSFDIVAPGEPDANGTLTKLLISNSDGTYAPNVANSNNATIGRGGLAHIYTYLAGIGANFNGLINTSAGTFTNNPGQQEIGLITGSPTGASLLDLTDLNLDGNPDTYPGTGTTAPVDPSIATTYLGAGGNWVDIYRFKYTITNQAARAISFQLLNLSALAGSGLALSNGVWGPVQTNVPFSSTGIFFPFPSPGVGGLLLFGAGALGVRRRRSR